MKRLIVGIVDYGIGNYASLQHALNKNGQRCRISQNQNILNECDILLLPGVGAFRPAMEALKKRGLDSFLLQQARFKRPILGICLGMQLLADASYEGGYTKGLGLIPGEIISLNNPRWHIGWNDIEILKNDTLFRPSKEKSFYFNHSYTYQGPDEFQVCMSMSKKRIISAIRREKIVGVQFHPEKSQLAGSILLNHLFREICHA